MVTTLGQGVAGIYIRIPGQPSKVTVPAYPTTNWFEDLTPQVHIRFGDIDLEKLPGEILIMSLGFEPLA